jgi:hypothetical protein
LTLPAQAAKYEPLSGEFEPQPFQFVGPLEEYPQPAPVRYLLLSHWDGPEGMNAWLNSPQITKVLDGERDHLNAAGSQRGWARERDRHAVGTDATRPNSSR